MSAEKAPTDLHVEESDIDIDGYDANLTWSPEEEQALRRKIDLHIMPLVMLGFMFMQFDRGNIAYALNDEFAKDVNLTVTQISNGQSIFSAAFIFFELPSNIIGKRLGPHRWLPCLMIAWGIVGFCGIWVKDHKGYYAWRFFVAAGESGYIPITILYMTKFYKRRELATRLAWYWSALATANAVSALIAYGVFHIKDSALHGWQYLFLIEACPVVVLGMFFYIYLPASPTKTKGSIRGKRGWFTDREEAILITRVVRDDPSKGSNSKKPFHWHDIIATFTDWKVWAHFFIALLAAFILTPLGTYGPSIVRSIGYESITANAMWVPVCAANALMMCVLSYSSDRLKERALHTLFALLWQMAACLWLALAPEDSPRGVIYAALVFSTGSGLFVPLNTAWLADNIEDRKRPLGLAFVILAHNLAGIPSSQLFRTENAPRYQSGFRDEAIFAGSAAILVIVTKCIYLVLARRKSQLTGNNAIVPQ